MLKGDDKLQVGLGVKKLSKSNGCVSYHIRIVVWSVEKRLSEEGVRSKDDRRWAIGGDDNGGRLRWLLMGGGFVGSGIWEMRLRRW